MNKTTKLLLATAALMTSAHASAPAASSSGFFAGLQIGMANTNAKYSQSNNFNNPTNTYYINTDGTDYSFHKLSSKFHDGEKINTSTELGKFSPKFGLIGGYGFQVGHAYLAVQVGFDIDTSRVKLDDKSDGPSNFNTEARGYDNGFRTDPTFSTVANNQMAGTAQRGIKAEIKRQWGAEIAFKAGAHLSPSTIAYVRLGVGLSRWKAAIDANGASLWPLYTGARTTAAIVTGVLNTVYHEGQPLNTTESMAALQKTVNKTKTGFTFSPGLGLMTFVNKNMFVGAEYKYSFSPKLTVEQNIDGIAKIPGTGLTHKFTTNQNEFNIIVGYKF